MGKGAACINAVPDPSLAAGAGREGGEEPVLRVALKPNVDSACGGEISSLACMEAAMAKSRRFKKKKKDGSVSSNGPDSSDSSKRRTYVIAGDWVVDENWFLVKHHSELSKHTGKAHYRRLETEDTARDVPADKILDLCGAGHVARVLYLERQRFQFPLEVNEAPHADFDLLAIGRWHQEDQDFLTHLVHSGRDDSPCKAGRLGYRVVPPQVCDKPPEGIILHTLDPDAPTMKAVRLYHQRGDGWEIVNRVDWEPLLDSEREIFGPLPDRKNVPVVIIDDLEKGAVTQELVGMLLKAYPDASWYVRAKCLDPKWLGNPGESNYDKLIGRLALVVIGPEVSPQLSPFECWHRKGRVTKEAMDVLGQIPAKNTVLLTERREIIGRFEEGGTSSLFWGRSEIDSSIINQVGWADAVLAGLVNSMNLGSDRLDTKGVLESALGVADRWRGVTGVPKASQAVVKSGGLPLPRVRRSQENKDWNDELHEWELARSGKGIIDGRLEVWRASARLKNYIACIQEKLDIINEIGRLLRPFSRGSRGRSLGILIQADSGSGKTHLARCLTDAFGFELLACDVSQMIYREELFEFFDRVATHQVGGGRPVLAFVDEINASLENSPVYGAFLAPLESNHYARRGKLHTLKPCVWLFTGTNDANARVAARAEDKYNDFLSRMTLRRRIDYSWLHDGGDEEKLAVRKAAQLEQVYFGATMILHHFPDVTQIDRRILAAFSSLEPGNAPFRTIRQVAAMLKNVRHGRVTIDNVADVSMLDIDFSKLDADGTSLVRVVGEP